jgi:hypothetical protein
MTPQTVHLSQENAVYFLSTESLIHRDIYFLITVSYLNKDAKFEVEISSYQLQSGATTLLPL